ncbi:hypothetical protein [uncultured Kordia sp.]|uniref:relaxase/mobilization nuclease domain-containing protein n=1 Tax=uncultured Kordia sp. TaxID=507699 RepID=UPI002615A61D|nr:hypothetical protein [uncultured Kordia sp.]
MIVKTISHTSTKRANIEKLIRYVFDKQKMEHDHLGRKSLTVKKYIRGYNIDNWADQFIENGNKRNFNHSKRTVLRHEIISFAPQDNKLLTRDILKDFGKYYLQHRSPKSMGVCGVHYDEVIHIHFIISGVGIDGKSTRISQQQFKEFKIKLQEFQQQKYPQLSHSIVDHAKKKV